MSVLSVTRFHNKCVISMILASMWTQLWQLIADCAVVFQWTCWLCSSGRLIQNGSWTSWAGWDTSAERRSWRWGGVWNEELLHIRHLIWNETLSCWFCVCVCVCQFLQDILDTLFSILDDNTDKYGPLVFQSLVSKSAQNELEYLQTGDKLKDKPE